VMTRGRAVQVGTASDLFERPAHTFVGHFIGSPGMNFLEGEVRGGVLQVAGRSLPLPSAKPLEGAVKLGVRPEYVTLSSANDPQALPLTVASAQDIGTYTLLTAKQGDITLRARVSPEQAVPAPGEVAWLKVLGTHTCFYKNEVLVA
jgi:glycerol transport system ATP-binding protein